MQYRSRLLLLALPFAFAAQHSRAVEVSLQLSSATHADCTFTDNHAGGYDTCNTPVAAALSPAVPQGSGSVIDLDAAGVVIRATLALDAFVLDGVAVPKWTGTYGGLPGQYRSFSPDLLAPPNALWQLNVTHMADQSNFAGEFALQVDQWTAPDEFVRWQLTLDFASIPSSGPPPCEGETLFIDFDGDGKEDSRDKARWVDTSFGDASDFDGMTISQFCDAESGSGTQPSRSCERVDFRNDEPLRKRPGDCTVTRPTQTIGSWGCAPAEFFFRSQPPVAPARTCLGFPVIDDADGDGEPDTTDRCPNTPVGATIDGDGCSAAQFCSAQSASVCKRADFMNDEPFAKKPRDCVRVKPRACGAAQ
jgi:hypothetical protein